MNLKQLADEMREAGVRSCAVSHWSEDGSYRLSAVELFDTIPAPPPAFDELDPAEEKLPSECIAPGCHEPNGWQFDSRYCAPHGRRAAGVKP